MTTTRPMNPLPYLILAAPFLAACVTPLWVKDGATQQDYATDAYECERDARMSGYFGDGIAGAVIMVDFRKRCMVARGWRDSNAQ